MNKYLKLALGIAGGAALGFAYYYFIGCKSGTCPITSNWHSATFYGALIGFIATFPMKGGKQDDGSKRSQTGNR